MTDLEKFLKKRQEDSGRARDEAQKKAEFWRTQYSRFLHGHKITEKAQRMFSDWLAMQPRG